MTEYHLAQVNIGKGHEVIDHPVMAEFVALLDEINGVADKSPGFIWRLQTETGNATDIKLYEDPTVILNLSVWESIEAFYNYTYQSEHTATMARRKEWFTPMSVPQIAMWWIEAGTLPTAEEAVKRLAHLAEHGPSEYAFTFKQTYPPPEVAIL